MDVDVDVEQLHAALDKVFHGLVRYTAQTGMVLVPALDRHGQPIADTEAPSDGR